MSCELYFLGAGRPASGKKPSALKNIASNFKAMDWQLDSFQSIASIDDTYFLGGYHIEEIAENYPQLNFLVEPQWEEKSVLNTLFHAPFSGKPVLISYSDTLFRTDSINKLSQVGKDVVLAVDSLWMERFSSRSSEDIVKAETLDVNGKEVEFTGLVYLNENAVQSLNSAKADGSSAESIGSNLLDLIAFFKLQNLTIDFVDLEGDWAEFNNPEDIASFILGTKADTLARLEPLVKKSHIGKQKNFTTEQWADNQAAIIKDIRAVFGDTKLVVRSSSKGEDNWDSSNAGGFESILNVHSYNCSELSSAIENVVNSYGEIQRGCDQVLVQEFLQGVACAGVVFTCTLESGAPYYRFNFDDKTQSTESVTAGTYSDLRTVLVSKFQPQALTTTAPELIPVLAAVQELETLLGYDKLDIEFAIAENGVVHIFQVRPVVVNHDNYDLDFERIEESIKKDISRYNKMQVPSPFIFGDRTLFANMPDWNPAEIIGTRPKPLAFSLYQELITNVIWAKQRSEFGYRDVSPHPLIVAFSGQPYIDVRASLNSFLPVTLSDDASERIVNAYIKILSDNPQLHDKLEFDVAFTIWTPDFKQAALARFEPYDVTISDIEELESGLKLITSDALSRLESDTSSIQRLALRRSNIISSSLSEVDKAYALLSDCKKYGTLAFSHAARAGFVATTVLKSLVSTGALSDERRLQFLSSFDTVAGEFEKDKQKFISGEITQEALIESYGHLRPGTYELSTSAYWEDPDQYLVSPDNKSDDDHIISFCFNDEERGSVQHFLNGLGASISVDSLIQYLIEATQNREKVKFEFTKNLSKSLDYCVDLGETLGFSRDDLSYMTYSDLEQIKLNMTSTSLVRAQIELRKKSHLLTKVIELPSLIDSEEQFYSFERLSSQPNYIGATQVIGTLIQLDGASSTTLEGKIVLIPQADPGYDWLFGQGILGLITQYGGANSHMAIRSAEIGLPAAIGVGEKMYDSLASASKIELDCVSQLIRVLE
ncbi:PEP-utilizing enzyme [Vibrio sp. 10N.261.46.E11]|uniref:PEP-utilizing enzyme n=1 Tax=Vibrio sp. 10N.261.46.E11 TaxID=3229662 RepID=UPI003552DD3F